MSKQWLTKNFDFEVKSVNEAGAFEGYAAVFNNVDFDGDKIIKGAFKRTIDHKGGKFPVLWQHRIDQPVGVNVEAKEDDYGLLVSGVLELTSNEGKRAHAWMKLALEKGLKVGLSIGYRVIKSSQDSANKAIRLLKELELFEYSIVTFPANELASVTEAKGQGDSMKIDQLFGGESKALDFNQAFSKAQNEQAMFRLKWQLSDALNEALDSTINDENITLDEKKSNVKTIYSQYADAMSAWFSKYLDLFQAEEDEEADDKGASDGIATKDVKKGSKIGKETRQALMQVCDMHDKACGMHKEAVKRVRRLCGGSKAEEESSVVPPPDPAQQKSDSDLKELNSLLSSLRATVVAK